MSTPTDDGRQIVGRGRIRVDARRALAKLREHLLVDLHLYATEVARAAVAAKATTLDVHYDADDVILTFDGQSASPTELPRLLDHVLGDGHVMDRHLRGLALGVNAALGLGPAFVDIFVRQGEQEKVAKVRFVPSVLESEDGALPSIEWIAPPKDLPVRSMRVHLRRRMSVNLLKRAATREVPREMVLLMEALHSAPLKLTSRGGDLSLPVRPRALLRVPFKERDLRRGVLEIIETPAGGQTEWSELGVVLLRKPVVAEPILPSTPHAQVELPVRILLDADELPTNASRSALREDAPLPGRAEQAARDALVLALQSLVALVTGRGKPMPGVEVLETNAKKLEESLGAMVCIVAGALRRGAALSEQARALLDLPLLHNAVGATMTPRTLFEISGTDILVHQGKEPHEKDLAPWLDEVVWLRGKTVERMLVDFHVQDAKSRVSLALVARERRRVLHARPPSEPRLPDDEGHIVKDTFRIDDGPFKGLHGQLALGAEGQRTGQRATSVRVYVEGRHIDTLSIDRDKLPLCIDAAIAWEGKLLPKFSYEGVVDDAHLRLALFQLTRLALVTLGTYFERSIQERRAPEERAKVLPLARAAIGTFATAAKVLDVEKVPDEPPLSAYTPLWVHGIWLCTNSERLPVSLAELKTYSDRTKAICYVAPGSTGVAPDGRPVVVLTNLEKEWLSHIFLGVTFVPYEKGLKPRDASALSSMMVDLLRTARETKHSIFEPLPSLVFETRDGRGLIAPSVEDQCLSMHAGVLLSTDSTNRFVEPATIVIEQDTTVPNPSWNGVLWSRESTALVHVRNDLVEKIVRVMEGDAEARKEFRQFPAEAGPILRSYLMEAVARFRTKELGKRLERLPLVRVLDADGRPRLTSLADVAARFSEKIPYLRAVPSFPTLDWQPLLLEHDREVAALVRWVGNRLKLADDELPQQAQLAQGELRKRAFLQKPRVRTDEPLGLADPGAPTKLWQEQPNQAGDDVTSVFVTLPRREIDVPLAMVDILYKERLVCSRPLLGLPVPVVARVFLPSNQYVVEYADVSAEGLARIEAFVYAAACALAADLVARAEGPAADAFFQDRRGWLLLRQLYACSVKTPARSDVLLADFALRAPEFLWPTVQGERHPYGQLVPGGKKLYYGSVRYASWEKPARGGSDLDSPIVYLPSSTEGALIREILGYMGHEVIDMSSALYALQSRRKLGSGHAGPTLVGSPEHAALRSSLTSLGFDLEGEIEITDGSSGLVDVETLHGIKLQLSVNTPISFRAIIRVEDVEIDDDEKKALAEKLAKAAVKLIESLADRVDELPSYVRRGLRTVVITHASRGRNMSKRRKSFVVFMDVLGDYHSVNELVESGESPYPYITTMPLQALSRRACPPLVLKTEEANAISSQLALQDVTEKFRRELQALERKQAAPLSYVGLTAANRLECLDIVPFTGEGIEGEVGILAPEHAGKRGIFVHKERRPLCKLTDGAGWPLLAIINDDDIPENKTFDGIKGNGAKDKLRHAVRDQAESAFAKWCARPDTALAGHKVRDSIMNNSVIIMGVLWLPRSWLSSGSVEVRDGSNGFLMPRTFGAPKSPARLDFEIPIPVSGRLFVANTGAVKKPHEIQAALSAWLLEETTALVLDAAASGEETRMVEGYRWILRFLGIDVGPLEALAADGRTIDSADVIETIKTKKEIWVSLKADHDLEGAFPEGMPPFILKGEGQALVDVLRARTNVVREFGAIEKKMVDVKAHVVQDVASFHFGTQATSSGLAPLPLPPSTPLVPGPLAPPDMKLLATDPEPQVSWLRSLVQKVVVFFDRPTPMEKWTEELGPSLMLAIDKLGLTPICVVSGVRYVRKGRPMVFNESTGELIINRAHPGVRSLAARVSHDPRARLLLVVNAVREINRVLEIVTDATERRVLVALLRGESL